jgi:hypothetical protein
VEPAAQSEGRWGYIAEHILPEVAVTRHPFVTVTIESFTTMVTANDSSKPGFPVLCGVCFVIPVKQAHADIVDMFNGRSWSSPNMIQFRSSSAADPWVLNNFGELVLGTLPPFLFSSLRLTSDA